MVNPISAPWQFLRKTLIAEVALRIVGVLTWFYPRALKRPCRKSKNTKCVFVRCAYHVCRKTFLKSVFTGLLFYNTVFV